MQCVCFSSFVNDFSLNLRCTLFKKSVSGGTFTSTFALPDYGVPSKHNSDSFIENFLSQIKFLEEKIQQASVSTDRVF